MESVYNGLLAALSPIDVGQIGSGDIKEWVPGLIVFPDNLTSNFNDIFLMGSKISFFVYHEEHL
jgi:hypothetical protein